MVNIRKLIHGSGLRIANLAASILIGFFLMPFLVGRLGDRTYGFWTLAGAILGYYGVLDFGILSAVQFYVAKALGKRDVHAANQAISTAFFAFAALGAFIFAVTIAVVSQAHRLTHDSSQVAVFRGVLLIMGAGFATGFPGRAFLGAMCAHMRWDLVSQFNLGALVLRSALIVVAVRAGGGLISLAALTVSADFLVYAGYYLVLRRIQRPFVLSLALATRASLREIVAYSAFTFVAKIGDQLRFYVDALVVGAFITLGAVAHYAVASRLAISFLEFMVAVLGLLAPWFSLLLGSEDHGGIRRIFVFGTKVSAYLATTIGSLLLLYGRPFITVWMGPAYLDAFWPLLLLTSAIFVDVAQLPSVSYLYGVYRHKFLAYATLVEGGANAVLSVYLARRYGMIGVALGTLIPMAVMKLVVQPFYVCRHIGLGRGEYYFTILGRAAAVAAAVLIVPGLALTGAVQHFTLLKIALLGGGQLAIALVAGYFAVFSPGERQTISRSLLQACRRPAAAPSEPVLAA